MAYLKFTFSMISDIAQCQCINFCIMLVSNIFEKRMTSSQDMSYCIT